VGARRDARSRNCRCRGDHGAVRPARPELAEALEAAVNPPAEEAALAEDWRAHWTWLDEESVEAAEESGEPAASGTAEEECEGPNLLPRCYDVRCLVCRSDLEYDTSDGTVKVTQPRNSERRAS
jgi:hypothetical protein